MKKALIILAAGVLMLVIGAVVFAAAHNAYAVQSYLRRKLVLNLSNGPLRFSHA